MLESAGITTVPGIGRQHGKMRPDRVAIHFEGRRITDGELDQQASRVANGLIAAGVARRQPVAILSKNTELIDFARERIAHYKAARSVDALPRNPSGTILKRELRSPYWTGRDRQV
jgi:acyl-CoA synthetase (AMP-forming)/AMP-acid ligase II